MKRQILVALRMTAVTFVLTGFAYPLLVTAVAQLAFARQANGSLVPEAGAAVGSELIAQAFTGPGYLQPRPSAAGADGFDATASSGSNLGPTSQKLRDRVAADVARLRAQNPRAPGPVPLELVTASGSGLDPHLSPEAAAWQAPRIAEARGVEAGSIREIIVAHLEPRQLGFLGEPRVNVLRVNLELDRRLGRPPAAR